MDDQLLTEEVQQSCTFENNYITCAITIQYRHLIVIINRKNTHINPTKVHEYRTASELLVESYYKPDTSHKDTTVKYKHRSTNDYNVYRKPNEYQH